MNNNPNPPGANKTASARFVNKIIKIIISSILLPNRIVLEIREINQMTKISNPIIPNSSKTKKNISPFSA